MTNTLKEDPVEIPKEIADVLSEEQKAFLNSCPAIVRDSIIQVNRVLNSPSNETRLGDFYVGFAYLKQALVNEENPYISIDDIMGAIVRYSAEKDHTLFTRKGEPNYAENDRDPQWEMLPKRRQWE